MAENFSSSGQIAQAEAEKLDQATIERFYRSLYRIRRTEEEIARIYPTDKIQSPVHLSIGQEAASVGVCQALEPSDVVFGTYRGHALYLAKGGDLKKMIAELYGKVTGCAKGKGGSMHLADIEHGVMGTSAVVATNIPQAIGYAYAFKLRDEPKVAACFFGDGATEEGVFHESMNLAALKRVPVLFICENNFYAIHSHQTKRQAVPDIAARAQTYGIPAHRIESGDVFEIYDQAKSAFGEMRSSRSGPRFLECMSYRWKEHVGPADDFSAGYRSIDEARPWFGKDPLQKVGAMLDPEQRSLIESEVEKEIAEAFEFAEASPFPPAEELYSDLYAA